jgi:hypothetical protein
MKTYSILICAALFAGASAANAQSGLPCEHRSRHSWCEIREFTLPFSGIVDADTGGVGAISVKAWDNAHVLLRARIGASAEDEWMARAAVAAVRIDTTAELIRAAGPSCGSWSVGYDLFVPRETSLQLRTRVGAISVGGVSGRIRVETSVGAIALSGLAGDVQAETRVGAIAIALDGERWDGKGLSAVTGTGAVLIAAPAAYSARFDLRTALGGLSTNIPGARAEATSFLGRKLLFDAGAGGAAIEAATSVGQIDLVLK